MPQKTSGLSVKGLSLDNRICEWYNLWVVHTKLTSTANQTQGLPSQSLTNAVHRCRHQLIIHGTGPRWLRQHGSSATVKELLIILWGQCPRTEVLLDFAMQVWKACRQNGCCQFPLLMVLTQHQPKHGEYSELWSIGKSATSCTKHGDKNVPGWTAANFCMKNKLVSIRTRQYHVKLTWKQLTRISMHATTHTLRATIIWGQRHGAPVLSNYREWWESLHVSASPREMAQK